MTTRITRSPAGAFFVVALAVALFSAMAIAPSNAEAKNGAAAAAEFFFDGTIDEAVQDAGIHQAASEAPVIIHVTEEEEGGISPMSASGTNGDTRISVTGSGLTVTAWQARGRIYPSDGYTCSRARFHRNNSLYWTSPLVCGSAAGAATYSYMYANMQNMPRTFADRDVLCNSWTSAKISGHPCITILK